MEKPIKFLELEKLINLQNSIAFLDRYVIPLDEEHEIRVNGKRNDEITELLSQLGKINQDRNELLNKIINHKERFIYTINNNVENKIIFSGNKEQTIEFVKSIMIENGDYNLFTILTMNQAKEYIDEFCDNLELIGDE
jgi:hypothetical protein